MWQKGTLCAFTEFWTLTVHNFQILVAMGMNIGVYTPTLLSYMEKEFPVPSTSGMGIAYGRINQCWKSPFYASLWSSTSQTRNSTQPSNGQFVQY